jgi:hypothetical protein
LYINSVGVAIVSGSIIYCVYCNLYLFFLIYTFRSQTGFPRGGFVQGHVDQKYCVYKCMLLVLRSVHYQQLNDVLGVLYLFELHVLISYGKNDMLEHPN